MKINSRQQRLTNQYRSSGMRYCNIKYILIDDGKVTVDYHFVRWVITLSDSESIPATWN